MSRRRVRSLPTRSQLMKYNRPIGQLLMLLLSVAELTGAGQTFGRDRRNSASDALSLRQLVTIVLANNPAIQAAQAKWKSARERIPQAAAWDDPKLNTGTVFGRFVSIPANSFTDQTLSVEQMIPVSGRNRSKERIAAAQALEVFEEFRRQSLDIVAKAKSDYYRLRGLQTRLNLNQDDEASLVQSVDATRARFEAGKQEQAGVLLVENQRQKVIEARRDLEQELSEVQSDLNVLMNRDPFIPVHVDSDNPANNPMPASIDKLREIILRNRPEVRQAQARLTAANAKLELAKREWIPDPTVSFEAQRYNDASQMVSQVGGGVSFSLPWFNQRKYHAEEAEARSEASAAQSQLTNERLQALGLLRTQSDKIETLHHHLQLYRDNLLPTARQTVASYLADYQTDKGDLQSLLSAQQSLFDLETMYTQDLADLEIAIAQLEALVGSEQTALGQNPGALPSHGRGTGPMPPAPSLAHQTK
jgi:outer membrane protein, heavy metal efflux system